MSKFLPKMYQKSIYDIDYKKIKKKNIKCLLFDLDNTCVPYKEKTASKELIKLFNKLKNMGFQVILFSNSPRKRLKRFQNLNVEYNAFSLKPFRYSFHKILKNYNYQKEEIMIIGDQLLTDIYGGNKIGILTCLVDPINDDELSVTKLSRLLEKYKINQLTKKNQLKRGEYYE